MNSLVGYFLVASPKMVDPNFFHTVVLIVQHNDEGALGLVLNRPLRTTIKQMWEEVGESECHIPGNLFQGGPCEGPLMAIHADADEGEMTVSDGIYFSTGRDAIERLVAQNTSPLKFFAAYAGWTAGQLEGELEEGSWLTLKADTKHVFEGDEHIWTDLVRAISRSAVTGLVDPRLIPDDPSVN